MTARVALLSFIVVLTAACRTPPSEPLPPEPPAPGIRVDLAVDRSGQNPWPAPSTINVWMTPIVGGVRGRPSGAPLLYFTLREGETFRILTDELQARLAAVAQPAGSDPVAYEPAQTRVARVGTFARSVSEPGVRYSAGFQDPRSGHGVIIVYVDRPCRILGSAAALHSPHQIRVDANLERAGLHWLVVDESEAGVMQITAAAPGDHLVYILEP